jgi:hypothetical protein
LIAFNDIAEIEIGMAEKSSPRTRQTDGKNLFWFEKKKENYPNYQFLPLLTIFPLNYFMILGLH